MKKIMASLLAVALLMTVPGVVSAAYLENPRSGKFHTESCRTVKHRENFVEVPTREQAVADGYVPCSVCHP